MTYKLGIDTGGTYTDAVLVDAGDQVVAAAKALTTKHDLGIGIAEAADEVLSHAGSVGIGLVALSTTLATNALVEGLRTRVGLILIGFRESALEKADLADALGSDPVAFIEGGHLADGAEQAPLDEDALERAIDSMADSVDAFAIGAAFAVRNPAHELAAKERVRARTGRPVSCSHELSPGLDGPRRALTALLNARLLPAIGQLIEAVRDFLHHRGVDVPLMIVRGDGSLIADDVALGRPIETILSGPAASVVGAARLADVRDGIVADLGGTTLDVALLRDGLPALAAQGARVGGRRTMVEAIDVHSFGLGGDSEVRFLPDGVIRLGPRRHVPLALLCQLYPGCLAAMRTQTERPVGHQHDGRFVVRLAARAPESQLSDMQRKLWHMLDSGPLELEAVIERERMKLPLDRLLEIGLVALSGLTPSDAAIVKGLHNAWQSEGARLGAWLYARQRSLSPDAPSGDPDRLADEILQAMAVQGAECLLSAAGAAVLGDEPLPDSGPWRRLLDAALREPDALATPLLSLAVRVTRPVVGLGASAHLHMPPMAERLHTAIVVPDHAPVANAVGAVVGGIAEHCTITVSVLGDQGYRVHAPDGPRDFLDEARALSFAEMVARATAETAAKASGARVVTVTSERNLQRAVLDDGSGILIGAEATATARGRPPIIL